MSRRRKIDGKKVGESYDQGTKVRVLALAEATSIEEASRKTGVPVDTIKDWRFRRVHLRDNALATGAARAAYQEAHKVAVKEVAKDLQKRVEKLVDGLYGLAEDSLRELRKIINEPGDWDRTTPNMIRALVGAMHYGIQDAQLVAGKPTARTEMLQRQEYELTHRIVAERPELIDDIFGPGRGTA